MYKVKGTRDLWTWFCKHMPSNMRKGHMKLIEKCIQLEIVFMKHYAPNH